MRHPGFFASGLMALALLGFTGSETALASYPGSSEFSMEQPLAASASEGSFKLAVIADSEVPQPAPPEKPVEKVAVPKPEKTVVPEPEKTKKKEVKKTSKPKKKKVKTAQPKKSEAKKAQAKKPEKKEEEDFFTKTLKSLVGNDEDKKADKDPKKKKSAGDKDGKKEESGFLTKTLKSLVGSDDDKDKKKAKKKTLNPMEVAPTVSATKKTDKDKPKTTISETKATLKKSFDKLVGVGGGKDKGDAKSVKKEEDGLLTKILGGGDKKDKPAAGKQVKGTPGKETKEAKKDEGGLLDSILGGGDKKKDQTATKQVKAEKKASQSAASKPKKITAKKTFGDEEKQLEKDRGGTEKGKNVLKESFKTLLKKEKEEE